MSSRISRLFELDGPEIHHLSYRSSTPAEFTSDGILKWRTGSRTSEQIIILATLRAGIRA